MIEVVQTSLSFLFRIVFLGIVRVVDDQYLPTQAGPLPAHGGGEHVPTRGVLKNRFLILIGNKPNARAPVFQVPLRSQ